MATFLTESPLEILAECLGENTFTPFPLHREVVFDGNMSMGELFAGKETGFRAALTRLLGTDQAIEITRSMTVGQFLAIVKQRRRDEAPEHMV